MLCANWYCKIVMWPIVRLRQPYSLVGRAYIQYCMDIWQPKKFVRFGSHTICESLKKRSVSIGRKKCSKNTITMVRNTFMTSWQLMNRGFTRMKPKVNSSRLYGCFNIQQKFNQSCSHTKHFQANDCLFSWKNYDLRQYDCDNTNSEWYPTICLSVVFQEIRKTNRRRRITLHHGNASSHTSAQTTVFLNPQSIDLMCHPPYSSDLAPNDFILLPYVKKWNEGSTFFDSWRSGWCVQNACFGDTTIRVAKVLRHLVVAIVPLEQLRTVNSEW